MIGSSKNNRENYPRKCFWTQERETRVKRYSAFEQLGPELDNESRGYAYTIRDSCCALHVSKLAG